MAVEAILPQRAAPLAALRPLAALLVQLHPDDPAFAAALRCALEYVDVGAAYEPYNSTHYRVESASRPDLWRYVTLDQCSCETHASWCWHRALVHLLTAYAALRDLRRCPRPQLAYIPPHNPLDHDRVLCDCDELW